MNLELLKAVHFQMLKTDDNYLNRTPVHVMRFAPLEHFIDSIDEHDIQNFVYHIEHYTDIILATMTARTHEQNHIYMEAKIYHER